MSSDIGDNSVVGDCALEAAADESRSNTPTYEIEGVDIGKIPPISLSELRKHARLAMYMKIIDNAKIVKAANVFDLTGELSGYESSKSDQKFVEPLSKVRGSIDEVVKSYDCKSVLYGSAATSLRDDDSNYNITILKNDTHYVSLSDADMKSMFKKLEACLGTNGADFGSMKLLRCKIVVGESHRIVDVIIKDHFPVAQTKLIDEYAKYSPHLLPLCRAVKDWAKKRGLVGAAKHFLNSWTLVLMCVQFLQLKDLLPSPNCSSKPLHPSKPFSNMFVSHEDVTVLASKSKDYYYNGNYHSEAVRSFFNVDVCKTPAVVKAGGVGDMVKNYGDSDFDRYDVFTTNDDAVYEQCKGTNASFTFSDIVKDFFNFYGLVFQPSLFAVSVRRGHLLWLEESLPHMNLYFCGLYVEEPFNSTDNTARSFKYTASLVQEFQRAAMLLNNGGKWSACVVAPNSDSFSKLLIFSTANEPAGPKDHVLNVNPENHVLNAVCMKLNDTGNGKVKLEESVLVDQLSPYTVECGTQENVDNISQLIQSCVEKLALGYKAVLSGSRTMELYDSDSDFDFTLLDRHLKVLSSFDESIFNKLLDDLKERKDFSDVKSVLNTRLISLKINLVNVDICFSKDYGNPIAKTKLINEYAKYSPHFLPLCRAVKDWAKKRRLVGAPVHLFNSWTLVLLCVQFLQLKGLLPVIHPSSPNCVSKPLQQQQQQQPIIISPVNFPNKSGLNKMYTDHNDYEKKLKPKAEVYKNFLDNLKDNVYEFTNLDVCKTSAVVGSGDVLKFSQIRKGDDSRYNLFIANDGIYGQYRDKNNNFLFINIVKDFFNFYGFVFQPSEFAVSVRCGHLLWLEESLHHTTHNFQGLYVEEPFDPEDNTARSFKYVASTTQEFQRAATLLKKYNNWSDCVATPDDNLFNNLLIDTNQSNEIELDVKLTRFIQEFKDSKIPKLSKKAAKKAAKKDGTNDPPSKYELLLIEHEATQVELAEFKKKNELPCVFWRCMSFLKSYLRFLIKT